MDSFSRFPFRVPRSAKKFVVLWLATCVCVLWLACSLACGHSSVGAGVPK